MIESVLPFQSNYVLEEDIRDRLYHSSLTTHDQINKQPHSC